MFWAWAEAIERQTSRIRQGATQLGRGQRIDHDVFDWPTKDLNPQQYFKTRPCEIRKLVTLGQVTDVTVSSPSCGQFEVAARGSRRYLGETDEGPGIKKENPNSWRLVFFRYCSGLAQLLHCFAIFDRITMAGTSLLLSLWGCGFA